MPWYFLMIPRLPFWRRARMQCSGYIRPYNIGVVSHRIFLSTIFLEYFLETGSFSVLILVCITSNYSWVNCPSLMSRCLLIIFEIGLSVNLKVFSSRLLKCFFHICIRYSWLAACNVALDEIILLLTSFTVYHDIRHRLALTDFLISLIWPWRYSLSSLWSALISFLSVSLLSLSLSIYIISDSNTSIRKLGIWWLSYRRSVNTFFFHCIKHVGFCA